MPVPPLVAGVPCGGRQGRPRWEGLPARSQRQQEARPSSRSPGRLLFLRPSGAVCAARGQAYRHCTALVGAGGSEGARLVWRQHRRARSRVLPPQSEYRKRETGPPTCGCLQEGRTLLSPRRGGLAMAIPLGWSSACSAFSSVIDVCRWVAAGCSPICRQAGGQRGQGARQAARSATAVGRGRKAARQSRQPPHHSSMQAGRQAGAHLFTCVIRQVLGRMPSEWLVPSRRPLRPEVERGAGMAL
jgi:hypothetical protein